MWLTAGIAPAIQRDGIGAVFCNGLQFFRELNSGIITAKEREGAEYNHDEYGGSYNGYGNSLMF
jgi:hypothetical protein